MLEERIARNGFAADAVRSRWKHAGCKCDTHGKRAKHVVEDIPGSDHQTTGVRPVGLRFGALGFTHVVAAASEGTRLVAQHLVHDAAEQHDPNVASRREKRGRKGPVIEIEIHAAGELLLAEGNLEVAGAHLQYAKRTRLDIDVAPWLARIAQLRFDLIFELFDDPAF